MEVSPAVTTAMRAVPRARFLPPQRRRHAGLDEPVPIGCGQTNSQPTTVAVMLTLLAVRPGQRVLDVGSGSGWTTALLSKLVGAGGRVTAVERIAELLDRSRPVLRPLANVALHLARPGVLGVPDGAPYDRILVSAEGTELPEELVSQLAPAGLLVIPVAGRMLRVERTEDGPRVTDHGRFRFVPLIR